MLLVTANEQPRIDWTMTVSGQLEKQKHFPTLSHNAWPCHTAQVLLTCDKCCTAHQMKTSAGACPQHAPPSGSSSQLPGHPSGRDAPALQQQAHRPIITPPHDALLDAGGTADYFQHVDHLSCRCKVWSNRHLLRYLLHQDPGQPVGRRQPLPARGADMSLYGRLYCTDRALGSAQTANSQPHQVEQHQNHCCIW